MLRFFVCTLLYFHGFSKADSSAWFFACVKANHSSLSTFYQSKAVRDLDPGTCSQSCLNEGYQIAVLSSWSYQCGSRMKSLMVTECVNITSNERTKDMRGRSEGQSNLDWLLGGEGSVALCIAKGPFLQNISVFASAGGEQARETFVLQVSGSLAGSPSQPTGNLGLRGKDLACVMVEFQRITPKGQSSHIKVPGDGSFTESSKWILENAGKYQINVCVCNLLYTLSSMLHLSILQPPPGSLESFLQPGPRGILTLHFDINCATTGAFYQGDPLTLQVCAHAGLATEFHWWFIHKETQETSEGAKTACVFGSHRVNSSVVEGFVASELKEESTENQQPANENISLDEKLLTTLKHPLFIHFTLNPKHNYSCNCHSGNTENGCYHVNVPPTKAKLILEAVIRVHCVDSQVVWTFSLGEAVETNASTEESVRIYTAKQAYPTHTDIVFLAVTDLPDPVEFLWDFGDSTSAKTNSRTIEKRYNNPGSYDVVVASVGGISVTSAVFPLVVQRSVRLNRLTHKASILQNETITVSCRVNVGTNLTFLWSFGDGTTRPGQSSEEHVFHQTGEFRVEVTAYNLVSSASLTSHVFVVDRPCQPPPVKNMGPLKLQVRRSEVVRLGVTYEADVDCDVSDGLNYTWTLLDSESRAFPLPLTDIHSQSLVLQSHVLQYDTYTAIAKVQVIGSVVYTNYSVKIQVMAKPPVAFIQGGTNMFINTRSSNTIILDGRGSYDADFPIKPLSYSWTCKPVSTIISSCFDQHIPTSTPVLQFPLSSLKAKFDQFQFTLTVHSGERSASSDAFITATPPLVKRLSIVCPQCQGDHVNWDQPFSVNATCEDCNTPEQHIQFSWNLYLVNASSKPVFEVPFCYTVDLSAPSAIMENPSLSHVKNASDYTLDAFEMQNMDSEISLIKTTNVPHKAGWPQSGPSTIPPDLDKNSHLYLDHSDQSDAIGEFPDDPDSSADWEFDFPALEGGDLGPDDDVHFINAEEGDSETSARRQTGVDDEGFSAGDDSEFDPSLHEDEGSNLVDPKPSVLTLEPTLLDLTRDSINRGLFESYTYTGISSSALSFRPFSLKPGSRYMLEVTAKSHNSFLGRSQLFLRTNPAPKGLTCQVQPVRGMELHTHFSIFCTSGREDLLYKYSYSIGGKASRLLYEGRDFQYYFSLPAGDPDDDYQVTIHIQIRSSTYGSATRPCSVSVQVQPSFFRTSPSPNYDPDQELLESGLRNLSALLQLGNNKEIRNYIAILSSILNRLRLDTEVNIHAQRGIRNLLICTVCGLKNREQESIMDNIRILKDLLQLKDQVTITSVRRVTAHAQTIYGQFFDVKVSEGKEVNEKMLDALISLLSSNLQRVTSYDFTSDREDIFQPLKSDSPPEENTRRVKDALHGCLQESSIDHHTKWGRSLSKKQVIQLVENILQVASDLMLTILFQIQEHTVRTDLVTLCAAHQNQTSTVTRCSAATFYIPDSLIQVVSSHLSGDITQKDQRSCILRVVTELSLNPYPWATDQKQLSGPVLDLRFYKCSTRRKISIRFLFQPINIVLENPQRKRSSVQEFILSPSQINYHSFNITPDHLQQAIQITVIFTPPPNKKPFPIMLLFSMSERPTPTNHHLQKMFHWRSNTSVITLLPSYLNAAGVGHLAVLDADLEKSSRRKHQNEEIRYSLSVDSSVCLSWNDQQRAWTHQDCRTQQTDSTQAVNCSCHQLRPLTVMQGEIKTIHNTADLEPFVRVSSDLTVLAVVLLSVFLYVLGLVVCKRADTSSEEHYRVHYLSDNSPSDPYLYAITIHTGVHSAASMTAKVYIVLHGEDGSSQTKELQVPGCPLFRRNSQDTFILSTADSLGAVWGVHIWHDNSGTTSEWYINHVEVSEVSRGHVMGDYWLFIGQCWLAVNKGDGRVERTLRVCRRGLGFVEMLGLKLSAYLADFHIWMSVYTCPRPHTFTLAQRLTVCLLLLSGYICINTLIVSEMGDQMLLESGVTDISAISVRTGLLSVVAALPVAEIISFLFRLCGVNRSRVRHAKDKINKEDCDEVNLSGIESYFSWSGLHLWSEETWRKNHQDTDLVSVSTQTQGSKDPDKECVIQSDVVRRKEDALAFRSSVGLQNLILISQTSNADQEPQRHESELHSEINEFTGAPEACLTVDEDQDVYKGTRSAPKCGLNVIDKARERKFSARSQWISYLAWTLCLLLSIGCLVLSAILGMRFNRSDVLLWINSLFVSLVSCIFLIQPSLIFTVAVTVSWWQKNRTDFRKKEFDLVTSKLWSHKVVHQAEENLRCSYFQKQLRARQRTRFLRLVRPPTPSQLRKTRGKRRREVAIHETLRDFFFSASMLFLMMCLTYGSSLRDHYNLNKAVKEQFTRNHDKPFISIQKHEKWWKWTQTNMLDLLFKDSSTITEAHILIGEPILVKIEAYDAFKSQVHNFRSQRMCGGCYSGPHVTLSLGHTKSEASSKLKVLLSGGWLNECMVALKVQLTLFSPALDLFSSVTLLAEKSPTGVLLPSVKVHSARVYHSPDLRDYIAMICQLLFLVLFLLRLCLQLFDMAERGLLGYWSKPGNWAEASLLPVTLLYYIYLFHRSTLIIETMELMQRNNFRGHVDVSQLASCEQFIRTLRGIQTFLLTMKSVSVLRLNRTFSSSAALLMHSLSSLIWPTISGLILLVVFSCVGNLLQTSAAFRSVPHSFQTFLYHYRSLHLSGCGSLYCAVLYLSSAMVWTAVVVAVMSSLIRSAKRVKSPRKTFTVAELGAYVRKRVSGVTRQHKQTCIGNNEERKMYFLEEFESSVDELLFKLNALSDSLHHTLPHKVNCHTEEDSRFFTELSIIDAQGQVMSPTLNNAIVGDHCALYHKETLSSSHHLRSVRGQVKLSPCLDVIMSSEEKSKKESCLSSPESATLRRLWSEDALKQQVEKVDSWFNQSQNTEVVVEVFVHEDPRRIETD